MMPLPAVIHCTSPAAMAPLVAHAVAVFDGSGKHVGDGLDAAMGMPREAGQIILRNIVAEVIEQKERVEVGVFPKPNARRRCTPAPSRVGLDLMSRFTGRSDIGETSQ